MSVLMNKIKAICIVTAILTAPSLYAQTEETNKTQPYGDNPNIFRVLAHKTGTAVQNTAEKVGNATEKGIQKIKPQIDETIENTKTYTSEQATIARDNTRQGIDSAVKKVEQTKDKIMGKTSSNIPIEQGRLSQSSTSPNSSMNNAMPATAPIATQAPVTAQPAQPTVAQDQNSVSEEPEIKKQSLPIENNPSTADANKESSTTQNSSQIDQQKTHQPSEDETGVPR